MRALFCKMKRGRETDEEMEVVPIKKKELESNMFSKKFFWMALGYLFPGFYGDNNFLAFRTWVALAGTCRRLRYWEQLRRWIAYVTPVSFAARMLSHGFPRRFLLKDLSNFQTMAIQPLIESRHFGQFEYLAFSSYVLDMHNNGQFNKKIENPLENHDNLRPRSDFDCTVGQIPFFNCITVWATVRQEKRNVLVYCAPTFAEMVLFCYAAMSDTTAYAIPQWFCVIPLWKHKAGDTILFSSEKRETFLQKSLLGKLRRIGHRAPQDYGYTNGSLQHTANSYFQELCDTSGSKVHTTPQDRLALFVRRWFKQDAFARTETEKANFALHDDEPYFY